MGEVYGAEKPRVSPSILMDYLDNDGEIDVFFVTHINNYGRCVDWRI